MAWARVRRPIGQILRDGGFISQAQLERALEEQKETNELLGEVLVRMGVLEAGEVRAALSVQEHLGSLEEAVRLAAGVRQMLGSLLVDSGRLSARQLELALAEQKRGGQKLGEVCLRLGFLSGEELEGLLAFQQHQELEGRGGSPLRLGELLVSAGHISRAQLQDALQKQALSRKKLGEVLVEEGYARPSQIKQGMRIQRFLARAVLAAIVSLAPLAMSGCGGGGGDVAATPPAVATTGVVTAAPPQGVEEGNYFTVTSDNYQMVTPTFLYSTNNDSFWSIQANVATRATDIDSVSVCRIDIPKTAAGMPELNQSFAIEEGSSLQKFPGSFLVFNGEKSVRKKVERGTISFTPDSSASGKVTGTFEVTLTDYDSDVLPAPQYQLKGSFRFVMGSYGPANGA